MATPDMEPWKREQNILKLLNAGSFAMAGGVFDEPDVGDTVSVEGFQFVYDYVGDTHGRQWHTVD